MDLKRTVRNNLAKTLTDKYDARYARRDNNTLSTAIGMHAMPIPITGAGQIDQSVTTAVLSLNSLDGDLVLKAGDGITVNTSDPNITVVNSGVLKLNSLTGSITLKSSDSSVSITAAGSEIDLKAAGGGTTAHKLFSLTHSDTKLDPGADPLDGDFVFRVSGYWRSEPLKNQACDLTNDQTVGGKKRLSGKLTLKSADTSAYTELADTVLDAYASTTGISHNYKLKLGGSTALELDYPLTGEIGLRSYGAHTFDKSLKLKNGTNSNALTLQAGATSADYTLTLPTAAGTKGYAMVDTDGSGTLGWAAIGGGSYVDLTTDQTIGGKKSFTDVLTVTMPINTDTALKLKSGSSKSGVQLRLYSDRNAQSTTSAMFGFNDGKSDVLRIEAPDTTGAIEMVVGKAGTPGVALWILNAGEVGIGAIPTAGNEILQVTGQVYATDNIKTATGKGFYVAGKQIVTDRQTVTASSYSKPTITTTALSGSTSSDGVARAAINTITSEAAKIVTQIDNINTRLENVYSALKTHGLVA